MRGLIRIQDLAPKERVYAPRLQPEGMEPKPNGYFEIGRNPRLQPMDPREKKAGGPIVRGDSGGTGKIITRRPDFNGVTPKNRTGSGGLGVSRLRTRDIGLGDAVGIATGAANTAAAAVSTAPGGFWANIGNALSNVVSGVLPVVAQVQAQKYIAGQQAQLLRVQGSQLYTPQNIQTLQSQAEFEAAQRRVDFGRQTGTMGLPISGTTLAIIAGALGLGYLAMRKK